MLSSGQGKEQRYEDAVCGSLGAAGLSPHSPPRSTSRNRGHLSRMGLMLQYYSPSTELRFIQTDVYSYFGSAVFHILEARCRTRPFFFCGWNPLFHSDLFHIMSPVYKSL